VLAAGDGAVLSHRDAAALHGMRKPPESGKATVTTPARARSTSALWVHGRRRLTAEASRRCGGSRRRARRARSWISRGC
jgi:hypothetical protein